MIIIRISRLFLLFFHHDRIEYPRNLYMDVEGQKFQQFTTANHLIPCIGIVLFALPYFSKSKNYIFNDSFKKSLFFEVRKNPIYLHIW